MNESLWGMVGRQRHEEMLQQAAEFRRAAAVPAAPGVLARLLIGAGRSLERLGERLAGGQVGDAAMGGIR